MSFLKPRKVSSDRKKKDSKQELLLQDLRLDSAARKNGKNVGFQNWPFPKKRREFEDDSDTESLFTYSTISRRPTVKRRASMGSFSLSEGDLKGLFSLTIESETGGNDQTDGIPTTGAAPLMVRAIEENDESTLRYLLEQEADPNQQIGIFKVTPLYIAVDRDRFECVQTLLEFGANPNPPWSRHNESARSTVAVPISPLRLAAKKNHANIVKVLLKYGAEVNGRDSDLDAADSSDAPLHKAASSNACGALAELLKAGAVVDIRDERGRTPLHYAAANAYISAMKILLDFGADPNAEDGVDRDPSSIRGGTTPMLLVGGHFVTSRKNTKRKNTTGYCEAISLLLKYGASPSCVDPDTRATPLHQAVTVADTGAVSALLSKQHAVNCQDAEGVAPLHIASLKGNQELVRLLLHQAHDPINIDLADKEGRTAIHKAAFRGSMECVKLLIQSGADLSRATSGGTSAVKLILSLPKGAQFLEEIMNDNISCNDVTPSERNFRINFNYSLLLSSVKRNQTCILNEILDLPERSIGSLLEHPLVESFLFLKWQKARYLYFAQFLTYVLLVLGITLIVTIGFCRLDDGEELTKYPIFITLQFVLLGFLCLVSFQELLQMLALRHQYFREIESWLKVALLSTSVVLLVVEKKYDWLIHVSVTAVFFGWAELMMLVGRLPMLGVYALMFSSVAKQIIKFLMAFSFLLIGFAICFHILFNRGAFQSVFISILRTLSMMTGDSEFEQHFYPEEGSPPPTGSSHVIYAVFLTLVSIVMMNLLIGLAVSDIQGLLKVGRLKRLRKQGRYLIYLESAVYSRVFGIFISSCLSDWVYARFRISKELSCYPAGGRRREDRISLPVHIYGNAIEICHEKTFKKTAAVSDVLDAANECKDRIATLTKAVDRIDGNCDCANSIRQELDSLKRDVSSEFRKVNTVLSALAVKFGVKDDSTDA